jgi:hypothetical protein
VQVDNSPEAEVSPIFQESASYYVLAFASSDQAPPTGQTHDIAVRVSRPDLVVQARSGYQVGQTAKALEAEARKIPLVRSVEAAFPRTDLPLRLSATPFAVPGTGKAAVAVVLRVEPSPAADESIVRQAAALRSETVNVVIAAIDPVYANIVGTLTQKGEIPLAAAAARGGFELLSRMDLAPGRYDIRAALDSASGARASVYTTVEIPTLEGEVLSMSGVAVQVSPGPLTAPENPLTSFLPIVPTARREFLQTDRVTAFVRIYQERNGSEPVSVAATITDASGRVPFQTRGEHTGIDYSLDLPVERLTAG